MDGFGPLAAGQPDCTVTAEAGCEGADMAGVRETGCTNNSLGLRGDSGDCMNHPGMGALVC